jgi:hypothetical protein
MAVEMSRELERLLLGWSLIRAKEGEDRMSRMAASRVDPRLYLVSKDSFDLLGRGTDREFLSTHIQGGSASALLANDCYGDREHSPDRGNQAYPESDRTYHLRSALTTQMPPTSTENP